MLRENNLEIQFNIVNYIAIIVLIIVSYKKINFAFWDFEEISNFDF